MGRAVSRRKFLAAAGTVAAVGGVGEVRADKPGALLRILGIACSPRKGKTTAQAVALALEAARAVAPEKIEVELFDLADLEIPAYVAAGVPLKAGQRDDFPKLAAKLTDPKVGGIIVGTPCYFGSLSALCKAFLDRCIALRKPTNLLANKVGGALAVGGSRSGGQELAIQCIHAALFRHEMLIVGDGRPVCHTGASLVNTGDNIQNDAEGKGTAVALGRRVADVALGRVPAKS